MFFFETSAKSGEGINQMMYSCIAKLPFFEQFKVDNDEKLIQELCENNSKLNNQGKVYNVDMDKAFTGEENTSNIILTKKIDEDIDENKRKCGC